MWGLQGGMHVVLRSELRQEHHYMSNMGMVCVAPAWQHVQINLMKINHKIRDASDDQDYNYAKLRFELRSLR